MRIRLYMQAWKKDESTYVILRMRSNSMSAHMIVLARVQKVRMYACICLQALQKRKTHMSLFAYAAKERNVYDRICI